MPIDVHGDTKQALARAAATPGRDAATGRFLPGCNGYAITGSQRLWSELEPLRADLIERATEELQISKTGAMTRVGLVSAWAEASLLRQCLWHRMMESDGPLTGRGACKAIFNVYIRAQERETKLARCIGLDRVAKEVPTLESALEQAND